MTKNEFREAAICASLIFAFVLVTFAPLLGLFIRFGITEATMWHLIEASKIIAVFVAGAVPFCIINRL